MREQQQRTKAEKRAAELEARIKAIEAEGDPFKRAMVLWKEGKRAQAVRTGFGVEAFDDDFLVQIASDEPEQKPLTEEQLTERIRKQLEQERQAQEQAQAAELANLRAAAVQEVGQVLVASPDKWPTVWALGITGEQLAAAIDASYDRATGRTLPPEQLFDRIEEEYRKKIQGLPWLPKAPEPPAAPRSFGSESRRGPVDAPDPGKPMSFADRQKARAQREAEWRARVFAKP